MSTLLQAKNLTKTFISGHQKISVLENVSLSCTQGTTYAITGASGSGKSTLLHLLAGLDVADSGSVLFNDMDITHMNGEQKNHFLNKHIGLVFQQPYLIAELTVQENVMLPGMIAQKPEKENRERAAQLLEKVLLIDKRNALPKELSGGQQQRVALARALFNEPAFLLADEPTGSLDATTSAHILQLLFECQKMWQLGLIISTHDQKIAEATQTVYTLHAGNITTLHHFTP